MAAREEVVLALPSPRSAIPRASSVRSTWIASSLRGLREHGHLDRYFEELPAQYHDAVRTTAAGVWLPAEVAMAHYEAADRLDLPVSEVLDLGMSATRAAHGGTVNVLRTLAGGAGATPWSLLVLLQRLWDKSWVGGGVGVTKLGPKEARIEIVQFPCAIHRQCRVGIRGVAIGMAEIFCVKAYAQEIAELCGPLSLGLRLAWA
jgi:hypothetical protein